MIKELLYVLATIIASCLVMILHEIPKTMMYKKQKGKKIRNLKVMQYIDPIGLIFSVIGFCGFSKPYMYHIRDKKTNRIVGYTGMISLLVIFVVSLLICKVIFIPNLKVYEETQVLGKMLHFIFWVVQYMSVVSLGMFFTNLFPILPFNMGNLIAGYSTEKMVAIMRNDYLIKMIFFIVMILGIIKVVSVNTFLFLYNL